MKKFLSMFLVLAAFVLIAAMPADKYTYKWRSSATLTCADTVTLAPGNLTQYVATLTLDTNVVIEATETNAIIGDEIFLKITADESNRTLAWGSGISGDNCTVYAEATKVFLLKYDGADYRVIPYPVWKRQSLAPSYNDTTYLDTGPYAMTVLSETLTGNTLVQATVTDNVAGDQVFMKLTASSADRTVTWGSNVTGVDATLQSGTTRVFHLVYDGSAFQVVPFPAYLHQSLTPSYDDTLSVDCAYYNSTLVTTTLTGDTQVDVDDAANSAGDVLILKLAATGDNQNVNFNTNMTAVDDSVLQNKTKVFTFVYDGTNFVQTSEVQIN